MEVTYFQSARPNGMLDAFAKAAHRRMVTVSCIIYAVFCAAGWFVFGGWMAIVCLAAAAVCLLYYKRMAYQHFGGVTGDLAGWFLQITELVLTLVIVLGGKL